MKKALIVIDAQNDYLSDGKFPLWNIDNTVLAIKERILYYKAHGLPVIFVKHLSGSHAAFFEEGSNGAEIISTLVNAVDSPVIIEKRHGNSFDETMLDKELQDKKCNEIELCGMMTQNCVLFTAVSEEAKKYKVTILKDACTSVSPVIHAVAIRGLSRIETISVL